MRKNALTTIVYKICVWLCSERLGAGMKKQYFLSTALTGLAVLSGNAALAAITTTTTTTYTYDFPNSTPSVSENVSRNEDCPIQYNGGGGGDSGGGNYADVDGDGYGDMSTGRASELGYGYDTVSVGVANDAGWTSPSELSRESGGGGGGGAGCFLTTAVTTATGEADNGPTLSNMRHLRDYYVTGTADGYDRIAIYYLIAPEIVARVNAQADATKIWQDLHHRWIEPINKMVIEENWHEADRTYSHMLIELVKNYLLADLDSMPSNFREAVRDSLHYV